MPEQRANGVNLFYELSGSGDPLVVVYGSWVDHNDWQLVVPDLMRSSRVLTYDRRGPPPSEADQPPQANSALGDPLRETCRELQGDVDQAMWIIAATLLWL